MFTRKFWDVECILMKLTATDENEKAEFVSKFEKDISFDGQRYSVKLPFKPYAKELLDNYSLARKRTEFLRQKLTKDEKLKNEYHNIILGYTEKGIIVVVNDKDSSPLPQEGCII